MSDRKNNDGDQEAVSDVLVVDEGWDGLDELDLMAAKIWYGLVSDGPEEDGDASPEG